MKMNCDKEWELKAVDELTHAKGQKCCTTSRTLYALLYLNTAGLKDKINKLTGAI